MSAFFEHSNPTSSAIAVGPLGGGALYVWAGRGRPVVVLLHGFDSSCLEFRRLAPALEDLGVPVVAPDVLGWGFTDARESRTTSALAKRKHLHALWQQVRDRRQQLRIKKAEGGEARNFLACTTQSPRAMPTVEHARRPPPTR